VKSQELEKKIQEMEKDKKDPGEDCEFGCILHGSVEDMPTCMPTYPTPMPENFGLAYLNAATIVRSVDGWLLLCTLQSISHLLTSITIKNFRDLSCLLGKSLSTHLSISPSVYPSIRPSIKTATLFSSLSYFGSYFG